MEILINNGASSILLSYNILCINRQRCFMILTLL